MWSMKNFKSLAIIGAYFLGIYLAFVSQSGIPTKIVTIIGLVSGLITVLYDRTDTVFKLFTLIMSKLSRSTVTWKGDVDFEIMGDLNFETLELREFKKILEDKEFVVEKIFVTNSERLEFSARYEGGLKIKFLVFSSTNGYGLTNINIRSEINCSYKDSKSNWNSTKQAFEAIREFTSDRYQREDNVKEKFSIKIIVDHDKNPFYKLSVSHLDAEIKYFSLEYDLGNSTKVIVTDTTLEASSSKPSEIEKIIKNYVILSKVG